MHTKEWYANWKKPEIVHGVPTRWGWVVFYPENLRLNRYVDVGYGTLLNAKGGIIIEESVEIGSHCSINSYSSINQKIGQIILKTGCCIGAHVVIMPNVTVGENSQVGSGAYLDKNIPPDMVVHPSQKLVYRAHENSKKSVLSQ